MELSGVLKTAFAKMDAELLKWLKGRTDGLSATFVTKSRLSARAVVLWAHEIVT